MKDLWATNFSNKAIYIADLDIRVNPNETFNLLKYLNRGIDAINNSITSGDIFKTKLIITNNDISYVDPEIKLTQKCYPMSSVSAVKIEYKKFSELENALNSNDFENLSDEDKEEMERQMIVEQENKLLGFMDE